MGNIRFALDTNGSLVETYTYDAFGTPTIINSGGTNATVVGNRFLFKGRDYLAPLGLYDNRKRMYHPGLGVFMQTDPIGFSGDSNNLYRFCGHNPLTGSDPMGEDDNVSLDDPDPFNFDFGGPGASFPDQGALDSETNQFVYGNIGDTLSSDAFDISNGGTLFATTPLIFNGFLALDNDGSGQTYGDTNHAYNTSAMLDYYGNWMPRFVGSVPNQRPNPVGIEMLNADTVSYGVAPSRWSVVSGGPLSIGDREDVVFGDGSRYTTAIGDFGPGYKVGEISVFAGLENGFIPMTYKNDGPQPGAFDPVHNRISTPKIPVTVYYYPGSHH